MSRAVYSHLGATRNSRSEPPLCDGRGENSELLAESATFRYNSVATFLSVVQTQCALFLGGLLCLRSVCPEEAERACQRKTGKNQIEEAVAVQYFHHYRSQDKDSK